MAAPNGPRQSLRGSGGCHADGADTVAARIIHDLEQPAGGLAELLKPEMALGDLVGALRPAEVGHHHRIAYQALQ